MDMQLHTAAPWATDERSVISAKVCLDARYDQHDQPTTLVLFVPASIGELLSSAQIKENARRIVACVNRCEGVSTETLEKSPDLATAFMSAENARLMQVNAELLAAAKQTIEENLYLADGDVCTLKVLKDAIAKAEAA